MATRLIMIEGLPGSGKSTTAANVGEYLLQQGILCQWFLEEDKDHPIDCREFALKDLFNKLPPLWKSFVEGAEGDQTVTIMESRLWQNTSLFMYMAEYSISEILALQERVNDTLSPLSPLLIYLHQEDVEKALGRLFELRGEKRMKKELQMTSEYPWFQSRGMDDFAGWVQFFREWFVIANVLYRGWPYQKLTIEEPHENWDLAYSEIYDFLRRQKVL